MATRQAYRRTDDYTPGAPKIKLVHAVSLIHRDANIANGGNPWPVVPYGVLCNDAAGEVIAVGEKVKSLAIGNRVGPIVDTENITGRESTRSWLAADEDGVLADFIVFDERKVLKLPSYLDWTEVCIIPCAGVIAWTALQGIGIGKSVLIQGTGGVSMFALKLARLSGLKVILSSSSDDKLEKIRKQFPSPPLLTVNNVTNLEWHEEVLKHTDGHGVDLVIEVGGAGSLNLHDLAELLPVLIDRRVVLRGINAGSKHDLDDLCAALSAAQMPLRDIIDIVYPFEKADEAVQFLWEGKQVGKLVVSLAD